MRKSLAGTGLRGGVIACGMLLAVFPVSVTAFLQGPGASEAPFDFRIAQGSSWDKFKRIRQGNTTAEEPATRESTSAPVPEPTPQPVAEAQAPANASREDPASAEPVGKSAPAAKRPQQAAPRPDPKLIQAPSSPTTTESWWVFYAGTMDVDSNNYYDPHGIDFRWSYSRKEPLPKNPRVVVHMHGSGGGTASMEVFGPSPMGDIEVRTQDAEAYNQDWREWWTFGRDGGTYPGRRIAATLEFLSKRYALDVSSRGIVLQGPSMGGAGAVVQTMILPDPWRQRIAYSSARVGVIMPRQIARRDPGQYAGQPPDNVQNKALWDGIDFSIQAAIDPVVRGIHYRHAFSSDDIFSAGVNNASTQLEFVNLVEKHKIAGAFSWVKGGHSSYEEGVRMPDMSQFERAEQDVTLDRAHPAITRSTGNFPLRAKDRKNHVKFPRGHYNMGISWHHGRIVDTKTQIVFPLKYDRRVNIGKGVPDQPEKITVSVTPRRPRNFLLQDGQTMRWSWAGGAQSGTAIVSGDTVTIDGIRLVSGAGYKNLKIFR